MSPDAPTAGSLGHQLRVFVVAPTRRDGNVTHDLLTRAGIDCTVCSDFLQIVDQLEHGVGAVVLTDIALANPCIEALVDAMRRQPSWSDIPTLLLTRERVQLPSGTGLARLGNVTLLERPSSARSMISAVEAALRARKRQYEIRDQLAALREAEAALREADVRKDEFLATLAHELRNPLAAIRLGLAVVDRSSSDGPRTARTFSMIERQTRLLTGLIDDLMDVSRIATGKVVIKEELIDLRAVLELGLETGQTAVDASRHDFRLELPPGPIWIRGDSSRLAQVVGNLVNNAGKFTPDGGRITVRLTEEADEAVLRVVDTGEGIPADQLDRVFEMFTQVQRTVDRARGGLGIGLSLVRRLVQLHAGKVSAYSEGVGKGSVFTVRLPVVHDAIAVGRQRENMPESTRLLKILVVDDNSDLAEGFSALLASYGHEVMTAYEGLSALRLWDEFEPDIVFCDIGLPGMNGHELARKLRSGARTKPALLVAVTGWGNEADRRLSLEAGFDLHHTKPIAPEQVELILASI